MSVKHDSSGRRYVEAEVEVPGTPEQVWEAIATSDGVSSWFVTSEFRDDGGTIYGDAGRTAAARDAQAWEAWMALQCPPAAVPAGERA